MSDILTDAEIEALEAADKKKPKNALQEIVSEPVPGSPPVYSDADMARMEQEQNAADPYMDAASGLRSLGHGIADTLGTVATTIDKYTAAPVRAGLGAAVGIPTQQKQPSALSVFFPGLALGEMYGDTAPTGKQIAAKMGMSEDDSIPVPGYFDDFTRKTRVSPAGIAGGLIDTATDPLLYLDLPEKAAVGVANLAEDAGTGVRNFARERAVKAATGENRGAIRKLARVSGQGSGDVDRAIANLHATGDTLLENDPNFDGKPAVGWFANTRGIGEEAERRRKFYGQKIGEVGEVVDRLNPGAITPEMLSQDVHNFSREIKPAGKDKNMRARVQEEAETLKRYPLAEDEIGPVAPLKFADAQELKGKYPWEPTSPDLLISDKDKSNRIHQIIGNRMDQAVEGAKTGPGPAAKWRQLMDETGAEFTSARDNLKAARNDPTQGWHDPHSEKIGEARKELNRLGLIHDDFLDAGPPSPSEEDLTKLNSYPDLKRKYGTYRGVGQAATEQTMRTLGRNIASPSTKLIGALELAQGRPVKAILEAAANQLILERGNAAVARGANAIGKIIQGGASTYRKWLPAFQSAATLGNAGVLALHHQLMSNDPEYRARMMQSTQEEP